MVPGRDSEDLMDIQIRDRGDHRIISVNGEVDLYNVSELKKALFSAIDGSCISIVVDMKDVNYMDSSGIGALVAGQKKMKAHNGKFALMNIHEDVLNILKLATLDRFFRIYDNEDELV
jgi:anti-sigma B factor antagonist